ncbi:MAG TPA: glycosyltransferase [Stellaceae bacterium]|nr:glycosyltransferase [Stellaceae bacterium]
MPPRKILHLITSLDRGGAQTMLARLVAHMDPQRFVSVVVSLIDGGSHVAELAASGIPVLSLGMRPGPPSFAALRRLRRIVRQERPALLQTWLYHADLLGLVAAILSPGLPLLWNLRCTDQEFERHALRSRAGRRLLAWASGRPDAVLVNSEAGRRFHAALGYHPKRWEVVPNGFDSELFRPDPERRARWRARLGLGDTQPLIGMVARVDPMKGHDIFFAAAERIAAARGDASFALVGAGTKALPCPASLRGRLHALGELGAIHEFLPALDHLVLSSRYGEGFPNVLGEAMACGVPCVATDVGDSAAIIGDTGRVVPPADAEALASSVLELLAQGRNEIAQLGMAARARILERYSLAAVIQRYERLYTELAAAD